MINSNVRYHGSLVDCSENPSDIRPVVNEIMRAANWLLEKLPNDMPLVILAGEDHLRPIHVMLQEAILSSCTQSEIPTALGFELQHDYASRLIEEGKISSFNGMNFSKELQNIAAYLVQPTALAPRAHQALLEFCHENGISVSFNDLSIRKVNDIWSVNLNDDFTNSVFHSLQDLDTSQEPINVERTQGIALRNSAIVLNAIDHIKRTKAKIYVQAAGTLHIFGSADQSLPYDESLHYQFTEKGYAVLTIMPEACHAFARFSFPDEALDSLEQSIRLKGMDTEDWFAEGSMQEAPFIKKIRIESNMQHNAP